jgi:hypothetical protein
MISSLNRRLKGLNPHQLQLLTDSALEMTALNQYNDER